MWLFLLLLATPLIEIALFIQVGGVIGLWSTLAIVVLTAALGTMMLRQQGARAMDQLRRSFQELRDPAEPLAHGAMILFSGALLLTPGFFTDAIGFALLIPAVRAAAYRWLSRRMVVQTATFTSTGAGPRRPDPHGPDIIEGDFEELDRTRPRNDGPSGWTQH
ncbi:FxsA family protein [Rhodovulum adriaticum]|uniref:UPF0716 protein FxsA n=1 Tax=Rhodovulum adriaticum TaxID=35804 RepID=A0A4R2P1K6_RHOAD|nr:FxsA family protein [Rhodovulum adriaticum]MBK1634875.1 exlusion protein FxsA [Rhodovulum adriaticum]TCP27545.1 UPF0716 protein FxsA [Rhodovulum adriaticum]